MGLFNRKQKENKINDISSIKALGTGCATCHKQYEYVKEAVNNKGLSIKVEYITDMEKIIEYGIMSLPAIVMNNKIISMGKVLKSSEIEELL